MGSHDEDGQNLGRAMRDEVASRAVPPARIGHGLFILSGNDPSRSPARHLDAADGRYEHISANLRIEDHQEFIAGVYEEAGELGNN